MTHKMQGKDNYSGLWNTFEWTHSIICLLISLRNQHKISILLLICVCVFYQSYTNLFDHIIIYGAETLYYALEVLTLSLSSTRSLSISSGSRIPPSQYSTWWVRIRKSPSYNIGNKKQQLVNTSFPTSLTVKVQQFFLTIAQSSNKRFFCFPPSGWLKWHFLSQAVEF